MKLTVYVLVKDWRGIPEAKVFGSQDELHLALREIMARDLDAPTEQSAELGRLLDAGQVEAAWEFWWQTLGPRDDESYRFEEQQIEIAGDQYIGKLIEQEAQAKPEPEEASCNS